ncbi:MAG: hypothetical protein AAF456_04205 [Planctomycetota bacterium]
MSDDSNLEQQLAAFGRTLERSTGEPIHSGSGAVPGSPHGVPRRWWAIGGAAAAGVLAIVGLVAVAGRNAQDDVEPASPAMTTSVAAATTPASGTTVTTEAVGADEVPAALGPVPTDPLGLEADAWRLIQRDQLPFDFPADVACPGTDALVELNGAASVRDTLEPPDSTGVDVDVNIIDVGSLDVGNAVADAFLAFGDCVAADIVGGPEVGAMSSVRASWFRVGPEFAIATIVGEGARTIVLEIENGPFADEVIVDLAQRSAAYLGGAPLDSATPGTDAPSTTILLPLLPEDASLAVPDDPLGLEADGWTLRERSERSYSLDGEGGDVECPAVDDRTEFDGSPMVADLISTPDGPEWSGFDSMRLTVIDVGERDRADSMAMLIGESAACWAEFLPTIDPGEYEVVAGGAPELGATWYRVGILIFVVVVGDDGTIVRLDPFGEDDAMLAVSDEMLTDLSLRAARFLADRSRSG